MGEGGGAMQTASAPLRQGARLSQHKHLSGVVESIRESSGKHQCFRFFLPTTAVCVGGRGWVGAGTGGQVGTSPSVGAAALDPDGRGGMRGSDGAKINP